METTRGAVVSFVRSVTRILCTRRRKDRPRAGDVTIPDHGDNWDSSIGHIVQVKQSFEHVARAKPFASECRASQLRIEERPHPERLPSSNNLRRVVYHHVTRWYTAQVLSFSAIAGRHILIHSRVNKTKTANPSHEMAHYGLFPVLSGGGCRWNRALSPGGVSGKSDHSRKREHRHQRAKAVYMGSSHALASRFTR